MLDDDLYRILVFLHVVAAMFWIGGGFYFHYKFTMLRRAQDNAAILALGQEVEQVGNRIFIPASGVVLLMGILMVAFGPYGLELWIWLALAGYVVTFLTGALFIGPTSGRLAKAAEQLGPDAPEVASQRDRLITIARIDFVVLLLIVLDMVYKPGA